MKKLVLIFVVLFSLNNAYSFELKYELIVDNLEVPWSFVFLPDDSILILERKGELIHFKNGKKLKIKNLPKIISKNQGGLFDIEFFEISNYVIITATIMLVLILIIVNSKRIFRKIFLKVSRFRFISKYELSVDSSYDILKNSLSGKFMIVTIMLSSLFWIIEGLIVYSVLLAFDIESLVFMTTITTYTSSILLGFISFLPMGIGVTEGTLTGFLSLQGIEISLAATIVVFIRIFTRWLGVGIGFVFLKMSGGFSSNNKKIE